MSKTIFQAATQGDRRRLARAISLIERGGPEILGDLADIHPRRRERPGAPHVVGVTGPPGAGKSTFVNQLVIEARRAGQSVAVVAVDPSSPFTGGAILADRIRMEEHALDTKVFVRSISSRGHLGGLCRAAGQVVDLLDASGWDLILVETVGVGQSELAVCEVADTVVVTLTPESGDTVQTMKAGLLEIADLFVVNKADRPGADFLCKELEDAVEMGTALGHRAEVLQASALKGIGVSEVVRAVGDHLEWCQKQGLQAWSERRSRGRIRTFLDLIADSARTEVLRQREDSARSFFERLQEGSVGPYEAAQEWVTR